MSPHRIATLCLLSLAIGCKSTPPPPPPPSRNTPASTAAPETPTPAAPTPVPAAATRPTGPVHFTDVTTPAGIHFRHNSGAFGKKYLPETMGSGVCAIDYDNDGYQDLFFVNSTNWPDHPASPALHLRPLPQQPRRHLHRRHPHLRPRRRALRHGCAVGDFDNDGHDDLYVTALNGNHLFRNLGNASSPTSPPKQESATQASPPEPSGSTLTTTASSTLRRPLCRLVRRHRPNTCALDGTHKSYCTPELYTRPVRHPLPQPRQRPLRRRHQESRTLRPHQQGPRRRPGRLRRRPLSRPPRHQRHPWPTSSTATTTTGRSPSPPSPPRSLLRRRQSPRRHGCRRRRLRSLRPPLPRHRQLHQRKPRPLPQRRRGLFTESASASGIAAPSASSLTFSTFFFDYDLDGLPDIFALNGHVADDIRVVQPTLSYPRTSTPLPQ